MISPDKTTGISINSPTAATTFPPEAEYAPGEVLVVYKYQPNLTTAQGQQITAELNGKIGGIVIDTMKMKIDPINYKRIQLIRLPSNVSVQDAVTFYQQNASVEYAQPNYIYYLATT